jgi:hypothetical protein
MLYKVQITMPGLLNKLHPAARPVPTGDVFHQLFYNLAQVFRSAFNTLLYPQLRLPRYGADTELVVREL